MSLEQCIGFTSLGTLILDDVYLPSGEVYKDVLGGSGSYGMAFYALIFQKGFRVDQFKLALEPVSSHLKSCPRELGSPSARAMTSLPKSRIP